MVTLICDRERSPEPSTSSPRADASPDAAGAEAADEEAAEAACEALYKSGRYSPTLLGAGALEPATLLTEPPDDEQRLNYLRSRLHAHNANREHTSIAQVHNIK